MEKVGTNKESKSTLESKINIKKSMNQQEAEQFINTSLMKAMDGQVAED